MSSEIMLLANICEHAVLLYVSVDNPIENHDDVSAELVVLLLSI